MSQTQSVNFTEDRLFSLGWGLINKAVCAPKSWSPERVAKEATKKDPPGTSINEWVVSTPQEREDAFNNTNCIPCPDCEDRQHWLLNC